VLAFRKLLFSYVDFGQKRQAREKEAVLAKKHYPGRKKLRFSEEKA